MQDHFDSIGQPATALFTDRGSKFYAFAYPVRNEEEIRAHLEQLRKEHFKARHHCFAWRLGTDSQLFRANDDGEPSGTAGRPILGQIDAHQYTDILIVVVRYFGGTLLGTSGLIHAYREGAHLALESAQRKTHYILDAYQFELSYTQYATFNDILRKTQAQIQHEDWTDLGCTLHVSVRRSLAQETLDRLKAGVHGLPIEEAPGLDWPEGVRVKCMV